MAYANKQQDHKKRVEQEGSYSPYNHIYNYLLNNYEPTHSFTCNDTALLLDEYLKYCEKGRSNISSAKADVQTAIDNFKQNNGKHGDTAENFGKKQDNSFTTIKQSLADLRW